MTQSKSSILDIFVNITDFFFYFLLMNMVAFRKKKRTIYALFVPSPQFHILVSNIRENLN